MRGKGRLAIAAIALLLSSCGSINVNSIPVPGTSYRDGYDIVIEFANVLNLPERAKVVMDGTRVGVTTKVTLTGRGVDVTSRIDRGVVVPSNIRAVLQQATVLGDTYVALERPANTNSPGKPVAPGGRILIGQTTSPPQLEDTIASMANFIGSGSIQRAQDAVININRVTPPRPEVRAMASQVAVDLSDLSNDLDNVDLWLDGLAKTAEVMAVNAPNFQHWFSPEGFAAFDGNFFLLHFIAPFLPGVGTIYYNGYWLVPVLESAADALEAFQHTKWAFDEEVPRWQRLFSEYFLPERKYPAINITSIIGPDGQEMSGDVEQVLRMIGAMP